MPTDPEKRAEVVAELAAEIRTGTTILQGKDDLAREVILNRIMQFISDDSTGVCYTNEGRHLRRSVLAALLDPDAIKEKQLLRATARVLGIRTHSNPTLAHAMALSERIQEGDVAALCVVEKRSAPWNKVPEWAATAAVDYFEKAGTNAPGMGKRGVAYKTVRMPNGERQRLSHEKQYLPADMNATQFFLNFKRKHPDITMRQRTCEHFRPWWWRKHTEQDRRTCQCSNHLCPKFAVTAVAEWRRQVNPKIQADSPDSAIIEPNSSLTDAADSIMCMKADGADFHRIDCIERKCPDCKGKVAFSVTETESLRTEVQKLRNYEYVEIGKLDKNGDKVKRLEYCEKPFQIGALVEHANKLVDKFPAHRFRNIWQGDQHDESLENWADSDPANGAVYLNLDWAERLTLLMNDEVQSIYWAQKVCGLLVMIQVRHKHASDGTDGIASTAENPQLWKRYVFVYWDDKDQGHQVIHAARLKLMAHDKANGVVWRWLEEWSDGCACQFRCTGA